MKAIWNNKVIAESNNTIVVENNHYFPAEAVNQQYLTPSATHTFCPWKGKASYYNIEVESKLNKDAAWYYPQPKEAAAQIQDYIAFWKGVIITS
jgi:uncharacterized protein (DUF427 family)